MQINGVYEHLPAPYQAQTLLSNDGTDLLWTDGLYWVGGNNFLGIGTDTPDSNIHIESIASTQARYVRYQPGSSGANFKMRHARGTKASKDYLTDGDQGGYFEFQGWGRNAADDADAWVQLSQIRGTVDGVDGSNRMGGDINFWTCSGVSAAMTQKAVLTRDGYLGVNVTDPDTRVEILDTGDQLKLSYSADIDAIFTVNSGGGMGIETTNFDYTLTSLLADRGKYNFTETVFGLYLATSNFSYGPSVRFFRSGGSLAEPQAPSNNDEIGRINFTSHDGFDYFNSASIIGFVDGTISGNDLPGRLEFWTTADGASSPSKRLVIDNAGDIDAQAGDFTTTGTFSAADITASGTITDGITSILSGNYTGVGNITGSDVDISAGTGNYTSNGTINSGAVTITSDSTNAFKMLQTTGGATLLNIEADSYPVFSFYPQIFRIHPLSHGQALQIYGFGAHSGSKISLSLNSTGTAMITSDASAIYTAAGDVFFRGGLARTIYFADDKVTQVEFCKGGGDVTLLTDTAKLKFGVGRDASIYYDGTDFVFNSSEVGSGTIKFNSSNNWTANGAANVTISNVAPAGVGTATISKWFTIKDDSGVIYYIPAWT